MRSAGPALRVALDARALNVPHLRGMGKYLAEVLPRVDRLGEVEWRLYSDRPDLPFHEVPLARARTRLGELRGARFHSWEQLALPWLARAAAADVLHCPATTLPWWQPVPTVVTLHDTLPWDREEEGWPAGAYRDRLLPAAYRKCAAIITISRSSYRDIVRRWPALTDKTYVIPHGIGDHYLRAGDEPLSEGLRALGVRPPYLLYLGGDHPRKRLSWALQVLLRLDDPRVQLVACGVPPGAQEAFRAQLPPALRPHLCFAPFVAEADLPGLYRNAAAVLYPTLYEGFGLPVVEAHAVGTPVLFSALGSLAELQGPAAVVLPPDDLEGWVAACRHCLAEFSSPHEEARAWARGFSWEACAARHLEVYRAVAGKRPAPPRRARVTSPHPYCQDPHAVAGGDGVPAFPGGYSR